MTTSSKQETAAVTGYCVKCKQKRDMNNPQSITFKNNKQGVSGTCPVCGIKMVRIVASSATKKDKPKK